MVSANSIVYANLLLYINHNYHILRAEHRYSNTIFLFFQVANAHYTFRSAHPAVPRPNSLHIVDRHCAVCVIRPVIERSADFDAVVETVYESFRERESFHVSVQGRCDVAVSGEVQAGCLHS